MAVKGWVALDAELGLHELEKTGGSGWCWRSLAVRLEDGTFAVVSPVRKTGDRLESLGAPSLVLAPNHYHYLGIEELRARNGSLPVVASARAAVRLRGKLGCDLSPLDVLRERLPEGVSLLEPPGLKTGEVWLRAETARGVAWAVCDAFFHVTHPVRGSTGLALKLTGTVPGLRIGNTFRWLAVADRRVYREWLGARLRDDPPRILIPAHGEVLEDDQLGARLAELAARRL